MWLVLSVGLFLGIIGLLMGAWRPVMAQSSGTTLLVSVASDGTRGNGLSSLSGFGQSPLSPDGRFVAFESWADNLVSGDTNEKFDVFVHDMQTQQTTRVSLASDGTQANYSAHGPSISADGRYVAFWSRANNIVPDDTNMEQDVFVHDRESGQTTRVSVASDGTQANSGSGSPTISGNGRYVVFGSSATNLVAGGYGGIFVHDRQTGETSVAALTSDGRPSGGDSPTISHDGRFVAFSSSASNVVPDDTNGFADIFVHDRQIGQTERVSVASDGAQGNDMSQEPIISADGRYVAFSSWARNLVANDTNVACATEEDNNPNCPDLLVHDRQTGETTLVSVSSNGVQGNNYATSPAISADGRFVAFWSQSSNLVLGDTNNISDAFVHDRLTGETERVTVTSEGAQIHAEYGSLGVAVSSDGRTVAFNSYSDELVPDDTNEDQDVFVRIRDVEPSAVGVLGPTLLTPRRPLAALLVLTGSVLLLLALRRTRKPPRPRRGDSA
jgi:cold shock CspA family protein